MAEGANFLTCPRASRFISRSLLHDGSPLMLLKLHIIDAGLASRIGSANTAR
jgi:hypothetical protein